MRMKLNEYLGDNNDYTGLDLQIMEVIDKEDSKNNFFVGYVKTKENKYAVMISSDYSGQPQTVVMTKSEEESVNLIAKIIEERCSQ